MSASATQSRPCTFGVFQFMCYAILLLLEVGFCETSPIRPDEVSWPARRNMTCEFAGSIGTPVVRFVTYNDSAYYWGFDVPSWFRFDVLVSCFGIFQCACLVAYSIFNICKLLDERGVLRLNKIVMLVILTVFFFQVVAMFFMALFGFAIHLLVGYHQVMYFYLITFDYTPVFIVYMMYRWLNGLAIRDLVLCLRLFHDLPIFPLVFVVRVVFAWMAGRLVENCVLQGREDHTNFFFHQLCHKNTPEGRKYFVKIREKGNGVIYTSPLFDTIAEAMRSLENDPMVLPQGDYDVVNLVKLARGNCSFDHLIGLKNIIVVSCIFYKYYSIKAPLSCYLLQLTREAENFSRLAEFVVPIILQMVPDTQVDQSDALFDFHNPSLFPAPTEEVPIVAQAMWDLDSINTRVLSSFTVLCAFVYSLTALPHLDPTLLFSRYHSVTQQINNSSVAGVFEIGKNVVRAIRVVMNEVLHCAQTGSVTSLFFAHSDFWKSYNDVILCYKHIHEYGQGDVSYLPEKLRTLPEFECEVRRVLKEAKRLSTDGTSASNSIRAHISDLTEILVTLEGNEFRNRLREAPFSVLLVGPSSTGKSTATEVLYTLVGKYFGLDVSPGKKYVWNGNAKHYDGLRSDQWCMQVDDMAREAANMATAESNTTRPVIENVNNVPFIAQMAALEDKGKINFRPVLFIATTNNLFLNSHATNSCPAALLRRFQWFVTVTPRPEFAKGDQLDAEAAARFTSSGGVTGELWFWTIKTPVIVPCHRRPILGDQVRFHVELERGSYSDMCSLLITTLETHKKIQQSVVTNILDLQRNTHFHKCCNRFSNVEKCSIHDPQEIAPQSLIDYVRLVQPDGDRVREVQQDIYNACRRYGSALFSWVAFAFQRSIDFLWLLYARGYVYFCFPYIPHFFCVLFFFYAYLFESRFCLMLSLFCIYYVCQHVEHINAYLLDCVYRFGYSGLIYCASRRIPIITEISRDVLVLQTRQFVKWTLVTLSLASTIYVVVSLLQTSIGQQGASATKSEFMPRETKPGSWWSNFFPPISGLTNSSRSAPVNSENCKAVCRRIQRNVLLVAVDHGETISRSHCLAICDEFALVNKHILYHGGVLGKKITIMSTHLDSDAVIVSLGEFVLENRIVASVGPDLILVKSPIRLNRKSLLEWFPDQNYRSVGCGYRYSFVGGMRLGELASRVSTVIPILQYYSDASLAGLVGLTDLGPVWVSRNSVEKGFLGLCGAPYVCTSEIGVVICGVHGAGSCSSVVADVCLPVYREVLKDAIALLRDGTLTVFHGFSGDEPVINVDVPKARAISVLPLHKNSLLRGLEKGFIEPIGSSNYRSHPRGSSVVKHASAAFWEQHGVVCDKVPPKFDRQPWKLALSEFDKASCLFSQPIMMNCAKHYLAQVLSQLAEKVPKWRLTLGSLSVFEVSDGIDDMPYVDHVNYHTSMGFPWYCPKSNYMSKGVVPEFLIECVERIFSCYARKERAFPVFCAHLKDEPISPAKFEQGKVRVFVGSPIDFTLAVRMRFLSFSRLYQQNRGLFESALSIAAQGPAWKDLYESVSWGNARIFGGDYKYYDKGMHEYVTRLAFAIIISICRESGSYSEDELNDMCGICEDTCNALVEFNGDFGLFKVGNPSGHPLTTIINCMANSLYMRYVYVVSGHDLGTFADNVSLVTYGDDNIVGVRNITDFNHTVVEQNLAKIGITYTMPDKSSTSRPFLERHELEFLGRGFRDEIIRGNHLMLAPLRIESIHKILCFSFRSPTQTAFDLLCVSFTTALQELAFHGEEIFEKFRNLMLLYCGTIGLQIKLHSREHYLKIFYPKIFEDYECSYLSPTSTLGERGHSLIAVSIERQSADSVVLRTRPHAWVAVVAPTPAKFFNFRSPVDQKTDLDSQFDDTAKSTGDDIGSLGAIMSRKILIQTFSIAEGGTLNTSIFPWQLFFANANINNKIKGFSKLRGSLKLSFVINASPFHYGAFCFAYKPLTWNDSTSMSVAGTPTGVIMFEFRDQSGGQIDNDTMTNNTIPKWSALSQRPHVMLYPQENTHAELVVPFILGNDFLHSLSLGSNQAGFLGKLDCVSFMPLTSSATASAQSINIDIFAELLHAEVEGPSIQRQGADEYNDQRPVSSTASAVARAAGALGSVPVIGPYAIATSWAAETVAKIAAWFGFTNTINIGPIVPNRVVMATRWADTEAHVPTAKLALDPRNELSIDNSICGVSRTDHMTIAEIAAKPYLAMVSTWTTANAVGYRLVNGLVAPAHFQSSTFVAGAGETILTGVTGTKAVNMSPAMWMAQCFEFWRGDMVLDFTILASKFHRGRLRFVYDPAGNSTNFQEGYVLSRVFDIGEDKHYRVTIPYQGFRPFLNTIPYTNGLSSTNIIDSGGNVASVAGITLAYYAGTYSLMVMTEMSGPLDKDVTILTRVSWANLEFAGPRNPYNSADVNFAGVVGNIWPVPPITVQRQGLEDDVATEVVPSPAPPNAISLVANGETCKSLRQLCHRWCQNQICTFSLSTYGAGTSFLSFVGKRFPAFRGAVRDGRSLVNTDKTYTFSAGGFLTWITPAFTGWRGGIMHRSNPMAWSDSGVTGQLVPIKLETSCIARYRSTYTNTSYTYSPATATSIQAINQTLSANPGSGLLPAGGEISLNPELQTLEAVVPDYSGRRFRPCNQYILSSLTNNVPEANWELISNADWIVDNIVYFFSFCVAGPLAGGTLAPTIRFVHESYAAGASDFNAFMFLNVPTLYVAGNSPSL